MSFDIGDWIAIVMVVLAVGAVVYLNRLGKAKKKGV